MSDLGMTSERSSSLASLTDSAYGTESQYSGESRPLSRADSRDTLSMDTEDGALAGHSSRGRCPTADTMEVESRGSHCTGGGDEDESHDQEVTFKVSKRTGEVTMEVDDITRYKKDASSCHGDTVTREGVRVAQDPQDVVFQTDAVTHYKVTDHDDTTEKDSRSLVEHSKEIVTPQGKRNVKDQNVKTSRQLRYEVGSESTEDTEVTKRQRLSDYDAETSDQSERSESKVVTEDTGDQMRYDTIETDGQGTVKKIKEAECSVVGPDGTLHHDASRIEGTESKQRKENKSEIISTTNDGKTSSESAATSHGTETKDLSKSSSSVSVDPSGLVKQSSHDHKSKHLTSDSRESSKVSASSSPGGAGSGSQKTSSSSQQVQRQTSSSSSSSSAQASSAQHHGSPPVDLLSSLDHGSLRPILVKGSEATATEKRLLAGNLDLGTGKTHKRVHFGELHSGSVTDNQDTHTLGKHESLRKQENRTTLDIEKHPIGSPVDIISEVKGTVLPPTGSSGNRLQLASHTVLPPILTKRSIGEGFHLLPAGGSSDPGSLNKTAPMGATDKVPDNPPIQPSLTLDTIADTSGSPKDPPMTLTPLGSPAQHTPTSGSSGGGAVRQISAPSLDPVTGKRPKRPAYIHREDQATRSPLPIAPTALHDKCLDPDSASSYHAAQSGLVRENPCHIPHQLLKQYARAGQGKAVAKSLGIDPEREPVPSGSVVTGHLTLDSCPQLASVQHIVNTNRPGQYTDNEEHELKTIPGIERPAEGRNASFIPEVGRLDIADGSRVLPVASVDQVPSTRTVQQQQCDGEALSFISDLRQHPNTGEQLFAGTQNIEKSRQVDVISSKNRADQDLIAGDIRSVFSRKSGAGEGCNDPEGIVGTRPDKASDYTCTDRYIEPGDPRDLLDIVDTGTNNPPLPQPGGSTQEEDRTQLPVDTPAHCSSTSTNCSNSQQKRTSESQKETSMDGHTGQNTSAETQPSEIEKQQTDWDAERPPSGELDIDSQKVISQTKTRESLNESELTESVKNVRESVALQRIAEVGQGSCHGDSGGIFPQNSAHSAVDISGIIDENVKNRDYSATGQGASRFTEDDAISSDKSESLAPLADVENDELIDPELDDRSHDSPARSHDSPAKSHVSQTRSHDQSGTKVKPSRMEVGRVGQGDQTTDKPPGSSVSGSGGAEGCQDPPWEEYADTDFTEDSEQTFVMNTDLEDDLSEPYFDAELLSRPPLSFPPSAAKKAASAPTSDRGLSMADKLNMISQSGVLTGHVTRKSMATQKRECDMVDIVDVPDRTLKNDKSPQMISGVSVKTDLVDMSVEGLDGVCGIESEDSDSVPVKTELANDNSGDADGISCGTSENKVIDPIAQSGSLAAILNLESAGIGEDVNLSTLERKRKRAKSEDKTASSRGNRADQAFSQQDVDDAVKKLRQSAEDSLKSQIDSYHSKHPQSSRRRYDWNTHHFFPDIHDFDVGILFTRKRSGEKTHRKYIEDDWLKQVEPLQRSIEGPSMQGKPHARSDLEEDGSDTSSGDDIPKIWRKNPLHVRRKKRSERRLSQEIRANTLNDTADDDVSSKSKQGYESPSLRKKLNSPRGRRSPRRLSNPTQPSGKVTSKNSVRHNSDLVQEKLEQFQVLQRRRRALESTSEESLAVPKNRDGKRFIHRNSDVSTHNTNAGVWPTSGHAYSQEDIRYEERGKSARIHKDLSPMLNTIENTRQSPNLLKPHQKSSAHSTTKPGGKSQYDILRLEEDPDRSIDYRGFYSPGHDQRKIPEDYKNISSSFENIYDTVDLSINAPHSDTVDVNQYMRQNLIEARQRLNKLQQEKHRQDQSRASVQTTATRVFDSHVDKQKITTEYLKPEAPAHQAPIKPKDNLSRLKCKPQEPVSDGSQPGTPTSPVWYVPKPLHKYSSENITQEDKEMIKKNYDAKVLMEEEQKKFVDYKRAYARKLSERDSTSGTSGDEQHRENKNRVIPPDDYDYILRKIHHKRQDAYYSESTSSYSPQEREKTRQSLNNNLPVDQNKEHFQKSQQTYLTHLPIQQPLAPANLSHLHLPLHIQHERSTSQLSTESSRELDQYFVKPTLNQDRLQSSSNYNHHLSQPEAGKPEQSLPHDPRSRPVGRMAAVDSLLQPSSSKVQNVNSSQPVITSQEDWNAVQDKMKVFEKLQSVHAELKSQSKHKPYVMTTSSVPNTSRLQVSSKPPKPKREDFTPQEPSNWNYNTMYDTEKGPNPTEPQPPELFSSSMWVDRRQEQELAALQPDRLTPVMAHQPQSLRADHGPPSDSQSSQPQSPRNEEYGLVFRLTPQGMLASSPSPSDTHSDSQVQMQRRVAEKNGQRRPASSTFYDLGPSSKGGHDLPNWPGRSEPLKDWRSQEDFQFLKDGIKYREKNAVPYFDQQLGRDRPGPPKTPPRTEQLFKRESQDQDYSPARQPRQPPLNVGSSYDHLPKPSKQLYVEGPNANTEPQIMRENYPLKSEVDKDSESRHKSWSSRIHEVESMRPTNSQEPMNSRRAEQPKEEQRKDSTRSFAIVAMADRNKMPDKKQTFKSYDDKVQTYFKDKPQTIAVPLERQLSSPNERSPHQSRASTQYEEHVKRTQEKYKSQTQASSVDEVDKVFLTQRSFDSEYVDPNVIRYRKGSSDSSHSSVVHKSGVEHRRSYGLQIQVEKGEPKAAPVVVKLSRSKDDLRDEDATEQANVSVSAIKQNLFGSSTEPLVKPSFKNELEKVLDRSDRKVSELRSDVFSSKDEVLPGQRTHSMSVSATQDEENDERLLHYASYKDGQARKRSNIFDVLTDLERTYEQLNLESEDIIDNAERREYVAKIQAQHAANRDTLEADSSSPNVKRLSITNVKMLEDLQCKEDNPSLEYAKKWIEEDSTRASDIGFQQRVEKARVTPQERRSDLPAPSDSGTSQSRPGNRSSLPRKVKDDMAYRRKNRTKSMGSQPDLPESTTMSYLGKSPTISPAQSVESLVRRPGRSKTPDAVLDDMRYRHMQRAKSPGSIDFDPMVLSTKSPTSTDYLVERTTEPARGRMRLRPERQADKYHDDLAYRQLRKDVSPLVAELPQKYYAMRGGQSLRNRSQSLDRVPRVRPEQQPTNVKVERSHSLGPNQQADLAMRASMSKGIAQMVGHFCQPLVHTQSAPDLTETSVFSENYNAQGDLVTDNPKYSKYAQKPKKQQTPRTVKMRNEMKSKMRLLKHSADSGYMEQSESDASHSSSGPDTHRNNNSPPDDNFDSDHDLSFSDPNSDRELRNVAQHRSQYHAPSLPSVQYGQSGPQAKVYSAGPTSRVQITDDPQANSSSFSRSDPRIPANNLPPHTFVFKLPQQAGVPSQRIPHQRQDQHQERPQPSQINRAPDTAHHSHIKRNQQKGLESAGNDRQQHLREIAQFRFPNLNKVSESKPGAGAKPSPPTRMSSLTHEPAQGHFAKPTASDARQPSQKRPSTNMQQTQIASHTVSQQTKDISQTVTQQKHVGPKRPDLPQLQPAAVSRFYKPRNSQPISESRKSWSGPFSGTNAKGAPEDEKIEITYPATIEMEEARNVEQDLQKRYRRSWHEPPLDDHEEGQQVKVEFAFKAPGSEQEWQKSQGDGQPSLPSITATNEERRAQFFGQPIKPAQHRDQKSVQSSLQSSVRGQPMEISHQPAMNKQLKSPQKLMQQPSALSTPAERDNKPAGDSGSHKQARYDLPVIRSKPFNQSVMATISAPPGDSVKKPAGPQQPSYTIVPITKKSVIPVSVESTRSQSDLCPVKADPYIARTQAKADPSNARTQAKADPFTTRTQAKADPSIARAQAKPDPYIARTQAKPDPSIARTQGNPDPSISRTQAKSDPLTTRTQAKADSSIARTQTEVKYEKPLTSSVVSSPSSDTSSKSSSQGSTRSPKIEPKSPKSSRVVLKEVKSVTQKSSDQQPASQCRTTQIEVMTSTRIPASGTSSEELKPKEGKVFPQPVAVTKELQPTTPVVTVSKHQSESSSSTKFESSHDGNQHRTSSSHVTIKSSDVSQRKVTLSQKSTHDKVFKMALPPMKVLQRGGSTGLLSPPPGKDPQSLLDRMRISPAERGFLSPPPRRAGLDHFELSDGEMTDATDITLDGLVRSNLARPSSPETLDFSDFCDNISDNEESSSGNSQQEYSVSGGHMIGKPKRVTLSESQVQNTEKKVMQKSDASSVVTRTVTRTEQIHQRELVTKKIIKQKDDEQPLESPSFKDLVKSFESKAMPFMRIQDQQKSASSEHIPADVGQTVTEQPPISRTLKQMSGSDPNLSQGRKTERKQPSSPTWRRV